MLLLILNNPAMVASTSEAWSQQFTWNLDSKKKKKIKKTKKKKNQRWYKYYKNIFIMIIMSLPSVSLRTTKQQWQCSSAINDFLLKIAESPLNSLFFMFSIIFWTVFNN